METVYLAINFIVPAIIIFYLGRYLFTSPNYKKARLTGSTAHKIFAFLTRLIALVFTALVSWVVLLFVGVTSGAYKIGSTYGTPIFRPKVRL